MATTDDGVSHDFRRLFDLAALWSHRSHGAARPYRTHWPDHHWPDRADRPHRADRCAGTGIHDAGSDRATGHLRSRRCTGADRIHGTGRCRWPDRAFWLARTTGPSLHGARPHWPIWHRGSDRPHRTHGTGRPNGLNGCAGSDRCRWTDRSDRSPRSNGCPRSNRSDRQSGLTDDRSPSIELSAWQDRSDRRHGSYGAFGRARTSRCHGWDGQHRGNGQPGSHGQPGTHGAARLRWKRYRSCRRPGSYRSDRSHGRAGRYWPQPDRADR